MGKRVFFCLLAGLLLLTGCFSGKNKTETAFLLNTTISITLYDGPKQALEGAIELCRSYEKIFSRTDPGSELYRLNNREISAVSDELAQVISLGLSNSVRSGGAFDITMGSVTRLWDFTAAEPAVPDAADVREALSHVGWEKVSVSGGTVTFSDPETVIDLGGIAKGYIADRLAAYLLEQGVTSAIIDLGGNLYCLGSRPDGNPFHVGIQYPYQERNHTIGGLPATDLSVVTSGIYERCFTSGGKLYHHILDTATGFPVENSLLAVTIVSSRSVDADALSTACFALGLADGMALVEATDGTEAVFITDDFQAHLSPGLEGVFYAT